MEGSLQLSLLATPENVASARRTVVEVASEHAVAESLVDDARLATSEAFTNVVRHAYAGAPGRVDLLVSVAEGQLVVIVRDYGHGLWHGSTNDVSDSGYGLPLIDALTDECTIVSASRGGTTVRMVFLLDGHLEQELTR